MSLLLHIDTAVGNASLCLSHETSIKDFTQQAASHQQSAWLHSTIDQLLKKNNCTPRDLAAISVSIGPGSYTGLRVGLAAAKGLCYALQIPLLTVNTLKIIAFAARQEATDLICPMIDARRMEVFTALYDTSLWEKKSPYACIINEESFTHLLDEHKILFCGNGAGKVQDLIKHANASFSLSQHDASHLALLAYQQFLRQDFADLAYTAPLYVKDFYSPLTKS